MMFLFILINIFIILMAWLTYKRCRGIEHDTQKIISMLYAIRLKKDDKHSDV